MLYGTKGLIMNLKPNRYLMIFSITSLFMTPLTAVTQILSPHPNRIVCQITTNLICTSKHPGIIPSSSTYLSPANDTRKGIVLSEVMIPDKGKISYMDVDIYSKENGFFRKAGKFACYRQIDHQYQGSIPVARVACNTIFKNRLRNLK